MEFDFYWLLALPAFFIFGWVAARIDLKSLLNESRALPKSYFAGLNFLLNEKPDQAVEALIEASNRAPDTVELRFALGSLFRRRGETDRAIRVHQNLVERDGLDSDQRLQALSELGQDYLKAGLLDRAEEIFVKLRESPRVEEAQHHLLLIYQQEKEWNKAIEVAHSLPNHTDHVWQTEMAQFYCELAVSDMLHEKWTEANAHLEQALDVNRKCVRALILQGDLAHKTGQSDKAMSHWKRVEHVNPGYLALVAPKLLDAYHLGGNSLQGLLLLRGYLEQHPSVDMLDAVFQAELDHAGADSAYKLVRDEVRRNPTLLGLDKLLQAQLLSVPPEKRSDLELVKNLIYTHTRRVARYRCDACGFKARQFYWRCPGCGGWETYPPRRTEEFDLAP
jgi:lipopolysaccharide assembly protein B